MIFFKKITIELQLVESGRDTQKFSQLLSTEDGGSGAYTEIFRGGG